MRSVGFINPGSLGDRLPRQGSTQENNMLFMGRPEGLRIRQAGRTARSPTGRSARKNERPLINLFGPPPTRALASGTSHLRAVSPIGRPSPKRCFLLRPRDSDRGPVGSLRTALLRLTRSGPTGAIQPGTPARKGPGANGERSALSQTTIPGPYPVRLQK